MYDANKRAALVESFVEINTLNQDQFLVVKETLTRIGVGDLSSKTLEQCVYLLHKRGRYYLVHLNQLRQLDGVEVEYNSDDVAQLHTVVSLLKNWKLVDTLNPREDLSHFDRTLITIKHTEKRSWDLQSPYKMGQYKGESA